MNKHLNENFQLVQIITLCLFKQGTLAHFLTSISEKLSTFNDSLPEVTDISTDTKIKQAA